MKAVFADSSFYVALTNPDDEHHAAALSWAGQLRLHVVLTDYILVELGGFLAKTTARGLFLRLLDQIRGDPNTRVVRASKHLMDQGLTLFRERPDKDWSLTDCISFRVMTSLKIPDALTADHHFEQAGFRALLKS